MKIKPLYFTTIPVVCAKLMEKLSERQKPAHTEENLEHLRMLFEHGIINKDEFEVMKRRIGDRR